MKNTPNPTRRHPEHEALLARYDAGELTAVALLALWTPAWDAARLRVQQAEAVATVEMLLAVSL